MNISSSVSNTPLKASLYIFYFFFFCSIFKFTAKWRVKFPGSTVAENPAAMQELWVQSQVQEGPLEEEMATHSSILPWEIALTEEPGGLQSMEMQRRGHD